MFKVGEKVKVLNKTIAMAKNESLSWQELKDARMVGEIVSINEPSKSVKLKAFGWQFGGQGEYRFEDIQKLINLAEVEEL